MSDAPRPDEELDAHAIPQERVQEMRKAIHAHLQQGNIYGQIRDIIDAYAADHVDFNPNSPEDIMKVVKERGLVHDILGSIQNPQLSHGISRGSRKELKGIKAGQRYLHVRLLGGRAFLDNLDAEQAVVRGQQMVVAVHFGLQRFRCTPQPCVCDPPFDDDFLVLLDAAGHEIIDLNIPLHIAVLKEQCDFSRSRIVGENVIEWRKVLKTGFMSMTVELCGDNPGVPSGIVELQLELIPQGGQRSEEEIMSRVQNQRSAITAADKEFLIYARRWWAEFHALRPTHGARKVKLFASTSMGRMIPVTHFVAVLRPDRVLDTPFHAARFVSLLALQKQQDLTHELMAGARATPSDTWHSTFSFLSQKCGDAPNHATLLCSLLLGYGLDAFCCIGTQGEGETHMWVCTRRKLGPSSFDVVFWEATTGERYNQTGAHPYHAVGCVFNHHDFFANVQERDNCVTCDFDLADESKWKSLNVLKLRMVPRLPSPPLLWIPLNTRAIELDLEASLKKAVCEHRDTLGLLTKWDEDLAFVLTQALTAYEDQRVGNSSGRGQVDVGLFNQCVKGKIGDGATFKGFPINVTHIGTRKILASIASAASGKEILELSAGDQHHSLRVKCFAFPEGVVSVWIMLAARYRPLQ